MAGLRGHVVDVVLVRTGDVEAGHRLRLRPELEIGDLPECLVHNWCEHDLALCVDIETAYSIPFVDVQFAKDVDQLVQNATDLLLAQGWIDVAQSLSLDARE